MNRKELFSLFNAFNELDNGFIILRDFKEDPNFYILEEDHDGYPEILYGLSDEDEILSWIESFIEDNKLKEEIVGWKPTLVEWCQGFSEEFERKNNLRNFLILFKEIHKKS